MAKTARPGPRFWGDVRTVLSVHLQILLPVALAVVVGSLLVAGLLALYAQLVAGVGIAAVAPLVTSPESATAVTVGIMLPIILIVLVAGLVWAGIVVDSSSAVISDRRIGVLATARRAVARAPRAALVALLSALAVVAAIALTPLIVVTGLLGLAVTPLARRTRLAARWPSIGTLLIAAIPLGAVGWTLARVALALPSVWLTGSRTRVAFADGAARSRGREAVIVAILIVTGLVSFGVGHGLTAATAALGWAEAGALAAQLLALVLVGPLLLVALTVEYHRSGPVPDPAPPARRAWRSRTAVAVAVSLVAAVLVPGAPSPAAAAGAIPTSLTIIVGFDVLSPDYSVPISPGTTTSIRVTAMRAGSAEGVQPSGTVSISVDGTPLAGPFALDGNPPSASAEHAFPAGDHEITVTYAGDSTFAPASATGRVSAGIGSTVTLAPPTSPVTYGVPSPLTATVDASGGPAGTIDFVATPSGGSETTIGSGTLVSGTATLDTATLLAPGTYSIVARYGGDSTHGTAESDPVSLTVVAAPTTTTFSVTPPSPSDAGTPLTAHVSVAATGSPATPRGTVAVMPSGGGDPLATQTLSAGAADLEFTLPPGMQAIRAYFTPDPGFESSWDELTYIVNRYASTVAITTDPVGAVAGQPVAITATVASAGTPTGSVSFEARPESGAPVDLGSASVGAGGAATVTTSALGVGDYTLVATYGGSTSVTGSTSSETPFTVARSGVEVTVTPNTTTPALGGTVRLTIAVTAEAPGSGTPSGSVTVSRDGSVVGTGSLVVGGVTTIDVPVGNAGPRTFDVSYAGNGEFAAGTGSTDVTVARAPTTTVVLTQPDVPADYGQTLTWEGTVSSAVGTPDGTVELWVGGAKVAEGTVSGGAFTITADRIPVGSTLSRLTWVEYTGDMNHTGSDSTSAVGTLSLRKATLTPTLSASPETPSIGGTTTLRLDLGDLAGGSTGTVTFSTADETFAPVAIDDEGVAELEIDIDRRTTLVEASFSGDVNLTAWDSDILPITADRELATVTLAADGPFTYGSTVTLIATVALGGGSDPNHGVRFTTPGITLADDVPIIGGQARLTVCVGDIVVCPTAPRLGVGDTTLTARYLESSVNLEGVSPGLPYSVTATSTTTTLELNTVSTVPGSAVTFTATVRSATGAVPTGSIAFGARMGTGPDGEAIQAFEQVPLVDGVAQLTVVVGTGEGDLRWPADAITAAYWPSSTFFTGSNDSVDFAVTRIPVTIGVFAFPPAAFQPTTVHVTLTHAGGSSEPFTGTVTVTADNGRTCLVRFPTQSSCQITWDDAGDHSVSATYSGDIIYAPAGPSPDFDLTTTKAAPAFGPTVASDVVMGTDVTTTWSVFDPTSTGTVSVWGDGVVWCTAVPVTVGQCTGRFGAASATGSFVEVRLQYSGDATWQSAERVLLTRVTGCATLDVRSTELARGTVTIDTSPNCGSGGYLVGTTVTVTAHPIAPNILTAWKAYGTSGLEVVSRDLTTSFLVGADSTTWVHVASFEMPCYPVTAAATGSGGIVVVPATNCTSSGGVAGYLGGTAVDIYPRPTVNPATGELDKFAFFGSVPGGTVGLDRFGTLRLAVTITGPTTIPLTFGPNCRAVTVLFDPAAPSGTSQVTTAPNCASPAGNGYHPGTIVAVTANPGDSTLAIASWSLGGVARPDLGAGGEVRFLVGDADPVLTANLVRCVTLTTVIDGGLDTKGNAIGEVTPDIATNCPDGSRRYLAGTTVVLTPRVLVADTVFRGWDGDRLNYPAPGGTGPVPAAARTVILTADTRVVAGFYLDSVCSPLTVLGDRGIVDIASDGCGPGSYFDTQKQQALRMGVQASTLWQRQYRSTLRTTIQPGVALDVYVSVRGDTSECFGSPQLREPGDRGATMSAGPLPRGTSSCEIAGPITLTVQACQTVTSNPRLHLSGDITGTTFGAADLPATVYAPGPDGVIGTYEMAGFDWIQGVPIGLVGGQLELQDQRSGPCRDAGNAFPADTDLALFATSPSSGITFVGFGDAPPAEQTQNPILTTTTATSRTLAVTADYVVSCHTLSLGEGISVVEGAHCPGTDPAANLFIAGTAVKVQAAGQLADGRWTESFTGGIVGGQIGSDAGGNLFGFAYMDSDKKVTADYPSTSQRVGRGIVQGFKIASGVAAIAAPIMIGWFFPPAGALFAYLGAAAGIANLIPGGREVGQVFELIDPTNITECAARWAFGNTGNPTGGPNIGGQLSTANTIRKIYQGKDVLEPAGAVGIASGAVGFGFGLYSAGIGDTDFGPQTLEELAGTSTMTGCLDQQWQIAGSNLSG